MIKKILCVLRFMRIIMRIIMQQWLVFLTTRQDGGVTYRATVKKNDFYSSEKVRILTTNEIRSVKNIARMNLDEFDYSTATVT